MSLQKWAASESWLKAACLMVSLGLHAGLGVIAWQGFGEAPAASGPLMVALAERPAKSGAGTFSARPSSLWPGAPPATAVTAPSRPSPAPVGASETKLQTTDAVSAAFCAIPATTVVETVVAEMAPGGPASGEVAAGGAGNEGGASGSADSLAVGGAGGVGGDEGYAPGGVTLATPRYASNPAPEYPRLARQNRWEGVVNLRATITAGGEVESLAVENSSGHQVLDASALGGVRRWRFIPARRGDRQVPCEVRIPVAFKLNR